MVKVILWGSLRAAANGLAEVEVSATNTREMLESLIKTHPELQSTIDNGVSVAIDGQIYKEAWFTKITPDSEVVLMPYMAGG
ncbi:MAG: MoaD/ThiS family protein [Paracoccaceae bacterium]